MAMRASTDVQSCRTVVGASMEGSSEHPEESCAPAGNRSAGTQAARAVGQTSGCDLRSPLVGRQVVEERLPFARFVDGQQDTAEKEIVQLVRVAHERLRFADDLFDRTGIEPPQIADGFDRHHARSRDSPRPPFLDFAAIQERVRIRIEQFGGERRRLTRVAGDDR